MTTADLPYIVSIRLGDDDTSEDADGRGESIFFLSNKPIEAWTQAWITGCKVTGVAVPWRVANDRDPAIFDEDLKKLTDLGFDGSSFVEAKSRKRKNRTRISVDQFEAVVLFVIQQGDPQLVFKRIEIPALYAGGLDLFPDPYSACGWL